MTFFPSNFIENVKNRTGWGCSLLKGKIRQYDQKYEDTAIPFR